MLRPISFTALAAAALLGLAACNSAAAVDVVPTAPSSSISHDVSLSITESDGRYSGTIRHDQLQCSGTLNDGVLTGAVLTIQKHIEVVGTCIVDLEVNLTTSDDDTLIYTTEVSTAVLTRT
jgi:hypothetical protein